MNDVRKHVYKMFANYPKTDETLELREEVIGNLEAEIEDLQKSKGISYEEAFQVSIGKMTKLDELIDGVKSVSLNKVMMEITQWTLIYTLVAWILTIPLSIFDSIRGTSWLLFLLVLIVGIIYLILKFARVLHQNKVVNVNLFKIVRWKRIIWIVWSLFMILQWGMVTAVLFGSDIWFGRSISINGPYEFGRISTMYFTPILSIIIPLLMNKLYALLRRVGAEHEG